MHSRMRWIRPFRAECIGFWHLLCLFIVFNGGDDLTARLSLKQLRLTFDEVFAWLFYFRYRSLCIFIISRTPLDFGLWMSIEPNSSRTEMQSELPNSHREGTSQLFATLNVICDNSSILCLL